MNKKEKVLRDDIYIVEHRIKQHICDITEFKKRIAGYKAGLKRLREILRALYKRLKEIIA